MIPEEELAKARRAVKTYGGVIEKQCRDVLDVTGLHHLINENGDGHWDVVWMRLFEMRDELANLKKARIAATIEDLDALPVGSVVMDGTDVGVVYQKADRAGGDGIQWYEPGYVLNWDSQDIRIPATILHSPTDAV